MLICSSVCPFSLPICSSVNPFSLPICACVYSFSLSIYLSIYPFICSYVYSVPCLSAYLFVPFSSTYLFIRSLCLSAHAVILWFGLVRSGLVWSSLVRSAHNFIFKCINWSLCINSDEQTSGRTGGRTDERPIFLSVDIFKCNCNFILLTRLFAESSFLVQKHIINELFFN